MTFHEAQVALARVYVGSDDVRGGTDEVVNIEKPHDQSTSVDQIGKKDTVEKAVHLPKTIDEVRGSHCGAATWHRNLSFPRPKRSSIGSKRPYPEATRMCK